MKIFTKHIVLKLTVFVLGYWTVMAYGLDLVQAQGSQIMPYLFWFEHPDAFSNDIMGMSFPYYGSYSLWYMSLKWAGYFFSPMTVVHIYFFIQCFTEVFALYFFARCFFKDQQPSYYWVFVILFTFGGVLRYSLGSVAPFGWTVFPGTMTTSLMLFALGFVFRKRFITAFMITAFCFNLHLALTALPPDDAG